MFLACFEPKIGRCGPWRIPKCLENGPPWDQNQLNLESLLCPLLWVIGLGVQVYS